MKECKQDPKHNTWYTVSVQLMFALITINIEAILWIPADSKDIMGLHKEFLPLTNSVFCNRHDRMPGQY